MKAVFVTLIAKESASDALLQACLDDAKASLEKEPDCLRFDVLRDPAEGTRFYLYEVYRDEQAFEFHKQQPHFAAFFAAAETLLAAEPVLTEAVVANPEAP